MESELCDHQRFHMETWSQHDAHASLVCTLCPLCWYKLYPVACYWAGKVWLWSLTSRLFFFLVSKLLSDLLKYEIWVWHSNSDFHFILFCGEFLENFDLEILKMEYISSQTLNPVSIGQICQAFEFVFSFGIYILGTVFSFGALFHLFSTVWTSVGRLLTFFNNWLILCFNLWNQRRRFDY